MWLSSLTYHNTVQYSTVNQDHFLTAWGEFVTYAHVLVCLFIYVVYMNEYCDREKNKPRNFDRFARLLHL
jgi:hypothetical protein